MDWPFLMLFFFGGLSALLLLGLPSRFYSLTSLESMSSGEAQ